MKERFAKIKTDIQVFWSSRTKKQKSIYIGSALAIILFAAFLTYFLSRTEYVPLYRDVSRAEIGRIKKELDAQGVPNEVAPGGTSILVPKEQVNDLIVSLAAEGFPNSGSIDYSFFTENAGFGTTDNEFNMIKVGVLQSELAELMKGIEGVQDANVMITLPTQSVFLKDQVENASAVVMLNTEPGHQFSDGQITALHQLVAKSLPNLEPEDVVILNQYSERFEMRDKEKDTYGPNIADQVELKKTIERDLQQQVQMMLGTMMGHDKVVVSATADIDFQQEKREENLVEPINEELESLAISVQRITETFTGEGQGVGGPPEGQTPTDPIAQYAQNGVSNGDFERIEETINNEVNRIRKEIIESPYKIRDIGLQVMIEPPDAENPESLSPEVEDDIREILTTIISTSVDKEFVPADVDEAYWESKIALSTQTFNGKMVAPKEEPATIPWWVYAIGGFLLLAVIVLLIVFFRNRKKDEVEEEELIVEEQRETFNVEDINQEQENETTVRRKQLEKMAKEKPEEFAKLLRTWIAED